jgi:hypothetical protein
MGDMVPSNEGMRILPVVPASSMKTYQILAPVSTHWREATCAEVRCPAQSNGWRTEVDESLPLGQMQAHYIRRDSKRKFTEERTPAGLTSFTFEAGQTCFGKHKIKLERPDLFFVRDGDWRGNPRGTRPRQHVYPEDWVEDFALHQQGVADEIEKG